LICSCVAKEIFSASPLLIYLLDLLRIPLKNSFNTFFTIFVNDGVDDVLADEENIIDVVHALRGIRYSKNVSWKSILCFLDAVFPHYAEKKE